MLECALNTNEWDKVTNLFTLPSVNALLEDEDVPLTKTADMYLALHEGRFGEIESKYAQASQLCLKAWSLLPSVGFLALRVLYNKSCRSPADFASELASCVIKLHEQLPFWRYSALFLGCFQISLMLRLFCVFLCVFCCRIV